MNIEELRGLNWKEKRALAQETCDEQILIVLAEDKSARVRKAIMQRADLPIEVIEKSYQHTRSLYEKLLIFKSIRNLKTKEDLLRILNQLSNDSEKLVRYHAKDYLDKIS